MFHMIRFFTKEEAIEKYNLPPSIAAEVFGSLRSYRSSSGSEVYAECEIDEAIRRWRTPSGSVGRKITTNEYGKLAGKKKRQGSSWSETAKAVNEKYGTTYNATSIRRCFKRMNDRQLKMKKE